MLADKHRFQPYVTVRAVGAAAAGTALMLFLIARNFWWAAWWPYMTWLLAMEKAANQTTARSSRAKRREEMPEGQYHRRVEWLTTHS